VVSYVQMLGQESNSSLGIRTVEWLKGNGARGLVNQIESIYYSLNAPAKGGKPLKSLPNQPGTALTRSGRRVRIRYYRPRDIRPIIHPALPGEGRWRATFSGGGSRPPVLVTSYRPTPVYPDVVAGVAWIDSSRTSAWLYPGISEPAVTMASRGPEEVPETMRSRLVATFNSGFKLSDSGGGFASGGHTYAPLKTGLATFVRYNTGKVDILPWSGGGGGLH
jgi:hypothetical protein